MKKNTIKAFTLVEMLIVIVIIGILIASLMPRMQSAQGRARDVSRKNDLAQIQTAIITSQQDRGAFPGMPRNEWAVLGYTWTADNTWATEGLTIEEIWLNLQRAGMSSVPADPNGSNVNFGLWEYTYDSHEEAIGRYIYLIAKRNWVKDGWFALMAKTEVEWWTNWIVCNTGSDEDHWYITNDTDLAELTLCKRVTQATAWETCKSNTDECIYEQTSELRYLLLY